ncbi:MAG: CRISPR-associated endonuclease Cas3'', partial [Calditrichaeota bacterium]|nr:CRISPR-associated endonuclease Cas3'' [Calditrichota bacterium]
MPLVVPLAECRARPDQTATRWPLVEHLTEVASHCGSATGSREERLAFLAGLLHDAGKCQAAWQSYARAQTGKGPPHAPLSAALFAWLAEALIATWELEPGSKQELRRLCLDWTRLIYCHHDALDDLDLRPPWEKSWAPAELAAMWATCDVIGLVQLVRSHFPELTVQIGPFPDWLAEYGDVWERRVRFISSVPPSGATALGDNGAAPAPHPGLRLAHLSGQLISADRYHAGQFQLVTLRPSEARAALAHLHAFCQARAEERLAAGASPQLVAARAALQQQAVERYHRTAESAFFSLTLPTGYGKTLTSVRVALEAVADGRCSRLIFVAPYLSILSQAADEVYRATKLPVLQHHSLSLLEHGDDDDVEALDSWQASVILTTFNQLFRVLFPRRAQ